jgi:ABC-type multidrug transport system fused ATPase/permease subunit
MRASNLRRLLAAIWADDLARRWLLVSQGALLVMVCFDLLIPQAIRSIVNDGILKNNINAIVRGSFYMAVFAVASMVFATINAWYGARVGEEVGHRLRLRLYRQITHLSRGFYHDLYMSQFRGEAAPAAP